MWRGGAPLASDAQTSPCGSNMEKSPGGAWALGQGLQ